MSTQSITKEEQLALAATIAASDGNSAAKRGILKSLSGAASLIEGQDLSAADVFKALSEGATRTSDELLFRVLSLLSKWLTPWGVLMLLALGLYQALQTAKASAVGFANMIKQLLSFASPLSAVKNAISGIFKDETQNADPAAGLAGIATLVATSEPLFGIMLRGLEQVPAVARDMRSISPQLGNGGYDSELRVADQSTVSTIAYDGELDIAYDEDGDAVDMDSLEAGDIVYDEDGNAYEVDEDGDLVPSDADEDNNTPR